MIKKREPLWQLMGLLFRAHPWHGVPIGEESPRVLTAYIEIVPSDTVKYELDKATGLLRVDRPQKFSNICPSHYLRAGPADILRRACGRAPEYAQRTRWHRR
jgi:inorganic pyrophosphatase